MGERAMREHLRGLLKEPLDHRPVSGRLRSALRSVRTPLAIAVVAGVALLAGSAEACPVCFQAKNDASRVAFIVTTGFMTGLPLLLVGGVAWWVRRQFRSADPATDLLPGATGDGRFRAVSRPQDLSAQAR
jgi:hypothetical protein